MICGACFCCVQVKANQQSISLLLYDPPVFPDMLYSFRQSLSASQNLRHLMTEFEGIPEIPCMCRGLSHINWTRFSDRPADDWLSEVILKDCVDQSDPPVVDIGNWTLESKTESTGMAEQGRALIIGISAGLTIALSVGAILVLFR